MPTLKDFHLIWLNPLIVFSLPGLKSRRNVLKFNQLIVVKVLEALLFFLHFIQAKLNRPYLD